MYANAANCYRILVWLRVCYSHQMNAKWSWLSAYIIIHAKKAESDWGARVLTAPVKELREFAKETGIIQGNFNRVCNVLFT